MADRRLQVFHAVAKHLSFTKAADALFMTQPAVTFQVRQLEEHYNVRLFERGPGPISLTDAGRVVFEYAERILALSSELDARMKDMTGVLAGPLRIGASTTIADYLLPQILGEFAAKVPAVVPRLIVANSESVQNDIAENSLDVGFIEGESSLPSLVAEVCAEDELQLVCAPSHPLAGRSAITADLLPQYPYVSREPGSGTREVADHYLQKAGSAADSLHPAMELGSPEALKGLVATGFGFTVMSRATVVKETKLGLLVAIPFSPPMTRKLTVVYPKGKFHSKLLASFLAFAKDRLAGRPQAAKAREPAQGRT